MYDVIKNIIGHSWNIQSTSDQQYIYYIAGALIIVLTCFFLDTFIRFFRGLIGKK